jgi:hypothetical protein
MTTVTSASLSFHAWRHRDPGARSIDSGTSLFDQQTHNPYEAAQASQTASASGGEVASNGVSALGPKINADFSPLQSTGKNGDPSGAKGRLAYFEENLAAASQSANDGSLTTQVEI